MLPPVPAIFLSSATLNFSNQVECSLNYNVNYLRKFNVKYNNYAQTFQPNYDFIARIAKNYDCRFYIDGNEYPFESLKPPAPAPPAPLVPKLPPPPPATTK